MPVKLGAAFVIIGGSMTVCGLMAWHLATRDAFDFSHATVPGSAASAATMQGVDAGTAGIAAASEIPLSVRLVDHPAVQYARAVQENDCNTQIRVTLWMAERLQFVRVRGGSDSEVAAARQELCHRLSDRRLERAQWEPTGVEDRYIFMPGAHLEVVAVEGGRGDLEREAKECVVFRVSYAAPERALRDAQGVPIRSLEARIWVSEDDLVLKATVLGDAEVDPASFLYDWTPGDRPL